MMNGISIETVSDMLNEAIKDKDAHKTLLIVLQLKEMIRTDPVAVKWVVDPTNIKNLHDSLIENLEVPAKMMMLKGRIPHRQKRAHLFVDAIENGIRKVL